jgi:formiminoglutamate deiminase
VSVEPLRAIWCELAWLGGERAEEDVLIELDGDRIASATAGVASPPPEATTLPGLTIPGMANAHSHAFQRALRGRTQAARGDFWTWRERMYEIAAGIDPDRYLALARATFGEMALAGITAVGEFHYLHHGPDGARYEDPNAFGEAVIAAAREVGVRITLLDTCYLRGGIGREAEGVQLRFSDGSAEAWAERLEALEPADGARVGAAIHSVRAVDPEQAAHVAAFAADRSWPLHAHVSEQPAENEECASAYGKTPTGLLAEAGALSERFTAVHATHLAAADVELLGGGGCGVCLCPTTERDLADGVGPARLLAKAGTLLSLGTDSHALYSRRRGRSSSTSASRPGPVEVIPRSSCSAPRPPAGAPPSAGRRPAGSSSGGSRTWSRSASTVCASRGPPPITPSSQSSSPRAPPTSGT